MLHVDRSVVHLTTPRDVLWFDEGVRRGWNIPDPAPGWMRQWGVRHLRCLWRLVVDAYNDHRWMKIGMYPTGYNDWARYAVLRGWC